MKHPKILLAIVAVISFGLIGVALYLQHQLGWAPCPLCVIQRYLFILLGLICIVCLVLPGRATRIGTGLAALAAASGAGVAGWHVWTKLHPTISCGIDPMETALNRIPPAEWLPFLFQADGLCSTPYPPILGLEVPEWSLVWFSLFTVVLGWAALRRKT